ncbi:MAG: hypothetical protein OCD01_18125 [Fibrobacterales bacterium]
MRSFFVVLLCMSLSLTAQTIIRVPDMDSGGENESDERKSIGVAIGLSLLLPGSGEAYLGSKFRQKVFLTSEVVSWLVTGTAYVMREQYKTTAHAYAIRWAGATGAPKNIEYMERMEKFRSRNGVDGQPNAQGEYDNYNLYLQRNGQALDSEYPNSTPYMWDWGTSDNPENSRHWDRYGEILSKYRRAEIVVKASIGALILNRVISAVSVVQFYKSNSLNNLQAVPLILDERPGVLVVVGF